MSPEERSRILVLGIGNTLLKDEGAGVGVVKQLEQLNPDVPDIVWMDGGTLSFTLAPDVEASRYLIVLDVTQLRAPPGTVEVFEDEAMDRMLAGHGRSVHEVGIMDLMDMARLSEALPERRALVGIQPRAIEWGEEPTPEVAAAMPVAARAVAELIQRWTGTVIRAE